MKTHINNQINFLEFPVPSAGILKKAQRFYEDIFGWKFNSWGDDYIDTDDSGLSCGINADSSHKSNAPLVVIYVEKLDVVLDKIELAGCKITKKIFSFPGGRRFHYLDPAGNELAVWSDN